MKETQKGMTITTKCQEDNKLILKVIKENVKLKELKVP